MEPSSLPPPEHPAVRLLRGLLCGILALSIASLVGLAVIALTPSLTSALAAGLGWGEPSNRGGRTLFFLLLGAIALAGLLGWVGRRLGFRALAGIAAVVAVAVAYLAVDRTPPLPSAAIGDFTPAYADAEDSYAVLMRYGKNQPAAQELAVSRLRWVGFKPEDPAPWIEFVTAHRAEIEAEWETLAPVRRWWTELNAFDHITDLMPLRLDAETVAFAPIRALAQRGCALATLQALDGQGDAALETLIPLLEVGRKLQETGRSLVIMMVANVVERMAMETASFVLARAPISAAVHGRLQAVLQRPGGGEAGARRMVAVERVLLRNTLLESGPDSLVTEGAAGSLLEALRQVFDPILYHPRATAVRLDGFLREAEVLIGRRDFDAYEQAAERFQTENLRPQLRNLGGRLLANGSIPAYGKVGASYWKVQDERTALLQQLAATPPAQP